MNGRTILIACLLLAVAACGGSGGGGGAPSDTPIYCSVPMGTTEGNYATDVFNRVNVERTSRGLAALIWSNVASDTAYDHSCDMDNRAYFSHYTPQGVDPGQRLTAHGQSWTRVGENIARGQANPAAVMASWMGSPDHRDNILDPNFTHLGVGVHQDGDIWWTQVFFTP